MFITVGNNLQEVCFSFLVYLLQVVEIGNFGNFGNFTRYSRLCTNRHLRIILIYWGNGFLDMSSVVLYMCVMP